MKLVISPAKSLDFTRSLPVESNSNACFLKEAESLNNILNDIKIYQLELDEAKADLESGEEHDPSAEWLALRDTGPNNQWRL